MPDARSAEAEHPSTDDLLLIGRVLKPHGKDGEVKVIPEIDAPARFEGLETVHLGRAPAQAARHRVENVRHQTTKRGPLVLLKLAGIDDRYTADAFRQQQVYAPEEALPPLAEDETFIHDLIGLEVVSEEGAVLGTVKEVTQTPAHDIFVVGREGNAPTMVPAVEEFVRAVDVESGQLVVRPIPGMFE